jgi:hypothetical protein
MLAFAQVGFFTTLLELAATSLGAGIVVGGFVAGCAGMRTGRSRKAMDRNALRDVFWGGVLGTLCLSADLLMSFAARWS